MEDFLTSLLDRAQERAPVLRWRRPSLYEPVRAVPTPDTAPDIDVSVQHQSQPMSQTLQPVVSIMKQQTILQPVAEVAPVMRPTDEHHVAPVERTGSSTIQPVADAHTADWSRQTILPEATTSTERVTNKTPEALPQPAKIETIIEKHVEKERTIVEMNTVQGPEKTRIIEKNREPAALQSDPTTKISQSDRHAEIVKLRSSIEQKNQNNPVVSIKPKSTVSEQLQPKRQPMRSLTPVPAPIVRTSPSPAPTIQVSIGRIEVRASSSVHAPTRSAKPAGPKLGLDDYLRARSGGVK